jgi:hypothetical protein
VIPPDIAIDRDGTGRPAVARAGAIAVLLGLAILVVLERAHVWAEPPERDVAGYAIIGHEMLAGRHLYSDLWERKPPLLYATFAAAERAVGFGPAEVFTVNVAGALATLAGVYAAGRAAGRTAGLVAAGLWVAVGGDLFLQANQPNAEVFVNAALAAAFAVLARWPGRPRRRVAATAAVGLLMAIATLYKHQSVVVCGTLLAAHALVGGRPIGRRLAEAAAAVAIVAGVWAGLFGWFLAVGRAGPMVDVLFRENADYAGSLWGNLYDGLRPAALLYGPLMRAVWPMLLLLGVAATAQVTIAARTATRPIMSPAWQLAACWAAGTWAAISIPGHFFSHYFQLWLPPACVTGGWAAAALLRPSRQRPWTWVGATTVTACVAIVAVRQAADYRLPPDQWSTSAYASTESVNNDFPFQRDVGRSLGDLLGPGRTLWELGEDNTLYFAARRSPPTGMLYIDPLVIGAGPDRDRYWSRLMADLGRAPPDLIVVCMPTMRVIPQSARVFPWMRSRYVGVVHGPAADIGRPTYRLYVRRDSPLRSQIAPASRPTTTLP